MYEQNENEFEETGILRSREVLFAPAVNDFIASATASFERQYGKELTPDVILGCITADYHARLTAELEKFGGSVLGKAITLDLDGDVLQGESLYIFLLDRHRKLLQNIDGESKNPESR